MSYLSLVLGHIGGLLLGGSCGVGIRLMGMFSGLWRGCCLFIEGETLRAANSILVG